jgi:hypothetical protein
MRYEKEFRKAKPHTVGEKDKDFDNRNYAEWLESQLKEERGKSAALKLMLNVEIGAKAALCKCTADKQEIPCDAGDYCMHSNLKP